MVIPLDRVLWLWIAPSLVDQHRPWTEESELNICYMLAQPPADLISKSTIYDENVKACKQHLQLMHGRTSFWQGKSSHLSITVKLHESHMCMSKPPVDPKDHACESDAEPTRDKYMCVVLVYDLIYQLSQATKSWRHHLMNLFYNQYLTTDSINKGQVVKDRTFASSLIRELAVNFYFMK